MLAMKRAVARLVPAPALALIDGSCRPELPVPSLCVVGGDGKCASIAAASILAKVTRDRVMDALSEKYPQYGFERHKGYGTEIHYAALRTYGPCPEHGRLF
jgi:ribonuclease HII